MKKTDITVFFYYNGHVVSRRPLAVLSTEKNARKTHLLLKKEVLKYENMLQRWGVDYQREVFPTIHEAIDYAVHLLSIIYDKSSIEIKTHVF